MTSPERKRARCGSTPQPNAIPSQCPITIQSVSDEVLLNIFRYFLDVSPRDWPRLVHTCRKWRHIVFAFQRALGLQLFCTHGTPVQKSLDCWPALPIVVQYGGSLELNPPAPEDEENIMVALKQSNRIISISLTVTTPLQARLSTIESPFSELEHLVLLSQDSVRCLTQPSSFLAGQWGTRLRSLHLTRIAILEFPQLLYSSRDLVDLQLHEALYPSNFSTEALTNAFSGMTQLRSLSLYMLPPSSTSHFFIFLPPRKRVTLPSLARFDFRGITDFLKGLVVGIDAPRLGDIDIEVTHVNESTSDLSVLIEFIDRTKMHKSPRQADILSSDRDVTISLTQPGTHTCLRLKLLCEPLTTQLSSMARICIQFSASLFNVEDLRINVERPSRQDDGPYNERWLEVFNSFIDVKWSPSNIVNSSGPWRHRPWPRRHESVLPALHKLYVLQPGPCHASLREAIVSFMTSRRLSGHPIAVEYEHVLHTSDPELVRATVSQPVTIEMLSGDVLLSIFRHCLFDTPSTWPILTWVCQGWRQIVLTSPLGLNLRLHCTYGTPVLKTLDCWPALPISVQYGGSPDLIPPGPSPEDDNNIIAALQQSGRVSSISLTVTSSLLEKLSRISEPLSELEELVLLSQDYVQQTLPSNFMWGPRLRTLHSTRIAFPSLPPLLLPCQDLMDLQLHEIPSSGYFPPEAFTNALSGTPQLRSLTLHLLSFPRRRSYLGLPPPAGERIVLAALTHLKYRGTSKYLDVFVARIDAPRLRDIDITLFSQPTIDASQLGRFVERTEIHTSLIQADVETSADAISISLTDSSASTRLRLQISCKQLDWQLSCMAQICDQFSPIISLVENISVNTIKSSSGQDEVDGEQWLELVLAFGGAKNLRMAASRKLMTSILRAFPPANESNAAVLPALLHLRVEYPLAMNVSLWKAFQYSRRLSGHPVELQISCHICENSFAQLQVLKLHLRERHGYRAVCLYCGVFECKLEQDDNLFREHLKDRHPEVARNYALISSPAICAPELRRLVERGTVLCAKSPHRPSSGHLIELFPRNTDIVAPWAQDSDSISD